MHAPLPGAGTRETMAKDTVEYTFKQRGSTYGAETGAYRRYQKGDKITAPEGEFRHLPAGAYETRPLTAETAGESNAGEGDADYEARAEEYHVGGGWYEVPGLEKKVRKDEAIAALKAEDE